MVPHAIDPQAVGGGTPTTLVHLLWREPFRVGDPIASSTFTGTYDMLRSEYDVGSGYVAGGCQPASRGEAGFDLQSRPSRGAAPADTASDRRE
jgi:hypothetical protein